MMGKSADRKRLDSKRPGTSTEEIVKSKGTMTVNMEQMLLKKAETG